MIFFPGHPEPIHYYMTFLSETPGHARELSDATRVAIRMEKPQESCWALLANGKLALLNYDDAPAAVRTGAHPLTITPYRIRIVDAAPVTAGIAGRR